MSEPRNHDYLDVLQVWLSRERGRLANAKTPAERELRQVWVSRIEREIRDEIKFLGLSDAEAPADGMTDDELLAALGV
jgi:hypothetical protein